MKILTNTLTELSLDWAVSKAAGFRYVHVRDGLLFVGTTNNASAAKRFSPVFDGNFCLSLLSRGGIAVQPETLPGDKKWSAYVRDCLFNEDSSDCWSVGSTPSIAIARCFVAIKYGKEIEVPDNLL